MTRNERIHGLGYCRSCLNETYGLRLKREDVLVYEYIGQCMKCGNTCHKMCIRDRCKSSLPERKKLKFLPDERSFL